MASEGSTLTSFSDDDERQSDEPSADASARDSVSGDDSSDGGTTTTSALSSSQSSLSSASTPPAPSRAPSASASSAAKVVSAAPERDGAGRPGRVQRNPQLHFTHADTEYIPMPPLREMHNITTILRRMLLDREHYPEGRHRMLDYFRVAVELFVAQVRAEYVQQYQLARRNGKSMVRFVWRNTGELAICFACCCDTLKLLYDVLQPGPFKPLWDAFVQQLFPLLIDESGVPGTILTAQTYHIKYMDWQKGGTRYSGDQSTTNVRFPSAQERRAKIETYLRSGAGYRLEAVVVDPSSVVDVRTAARPVAAVPTPTTTRGVAPSALLQVKSVAGRPLPYATATSAPPRPPFVRPTVKGTPVLLGGPAAERAATPPVVTMGSAARTPPELRHLQWLSTLAHIKGDDAGGAFPDHRAQTMPGFVRLCEMTERRDEMLLLTDVVAGSSAAIQGLFERLGGVVAFRRFASQAIQTKDGAALMHIVEHVVRLRVPSWGAVSQQAWRTNMSQRLTGDLNWLRTEAVIPAEKRAAWGALVLLLEQKYIFRPPRAEQGDTDATLKREREDDETGVVRAAMADNFDIQHWKLPRVNTLLAVRLPSALRAPPLCSALEQDMVDFLNAKRQYAEDAQKVWERRLRDALEAQHVDSSAFDIPLWYDPYQLLGVEPLQ